MSGPLSPALAQAPDTCGLTDVSCRADSTLTQWFTSLAKSALDPLLRFIGHAGLVTPQPGSLPEVHSMWAASLAVADAGYVILVLIGGVLVMSHETLQASYSVKEIAPRIAVGFAGANLSLALMSRVITMANGLSRALAANGVAPAAAAKSMSSALKGSVSDGEIFPVLLVLAAVLLLVLAAEYVLRLMAVVLLAAVAPLALALYALPQTGWAARWWWRALTAVLAVQAAQELVLAAAVRVFFSPGWLAPHVTGTLGQVLITLCLLYVMIRIPFWITRPVLSPFGGSPLRRAARFAVSAVIISRLTQRLRGSRRDTAPARRTRGGTSQ